MRFKFRGVSSSGDRLDEERDSSSREELILELQGAGITLFDLREVSSGPAAFQPKTGAWANFFGISAKTVSFFTRQMAELMESGIPLVQCIQSVRDLTTSKKFAEILDDVAGSLLRGSSLYESLGRHPQVFSEIYLSSIQIGETSGNLQVMLNRLAEYLDAEQELRGKIRSAMSYPVFILGFSMLLTYGMVSWLLPGFEPVWAGAGLDLNRYPVTLMLIKLGELTHSLWDEVLLVSLLAFLAWGFRSVVRTDRGARATDRLVYNLPVFGPFVRLALMTRVAQSLATLVDSGVPIVKAIRMSSRTAGNRVVVEALDVVGQKLEEGRDLGTAFEEAGIFPKLMVQMVALGSKSGMLARMLNRIAHYYRGELNTAVAAFTAVVEPLMMIIIGAIVFTFVIGVFVPIMGVVGALSNQV
jgi:type IV pilus assembly protein PilC